MNWEKLIFHRENTILNPLEILCMTQYLAIGKALLARLYQKVKVYVINLLNVYI